MKRIKVTHYANNIAGHFAIISSKVRKLQENRNGQCQLSTAGQTMTETEKSSYLGEI